jgi:ABC-type branched-subunit amino acid transport system ATPase component
MASMSALVTERPSSLRSRFSSSTFMEIGQLRNAGFEAVLLGARRRPRQCGQDRLFGSRKPYVLAEYDGVDDVEARITAALAGFGLTDLSEFPAAYLSAGQKRRLGLARLLVTERPIWLLDEPTSSLDAASSELVTKAINAHTSNGGIAIAATHLPLGLDRARDLRLTRRKAAA